MKIVKLVLTQPEFQIRSEPAKEAVKAATDLLEPVGICRLYQQGEV